MLFVESEASKYVSPKGYVKSMWNCKCDCGQNCVIMGSHLTTGHSTSCGCQQISKLKPRKATDLSGKKFGMLTVKYRVENRMIGNNSRVVYHCQCECGRETDVLALLLTGGLVKSCGCLLISHAERNMIEWFDEKNIKYDFQYSKFGLRGVGGGLLFFDFVVWRDNTVLFLVELDGSQHYSAIDHFGGIKKYEQFKANDKIKDDWANEHHIPLVRINVSKCTTDRSFIRMYEDALSIYID